MDVCFGRIKEMISICESFNHKLRNIHRLRKKLGFIVNICENLKCSRS